MNKKTVISPIMATIILLIVAVVAVVAFQSWFISYKLTHPVETKYFNSNEIANQTMSDYNCTLTNVNTTFESIVCKSDLCGVYDNKTYCETTTKTLDKKEDVENE